MGRPLSVLDASVLIALLDETDVARPIARAAVQQSKQDHDLLIPITAFSESIVAPYRRSRRDGQRAEAALAALGTLVEVTREVASRAAQLRATRNIKLPDALVLATAIHTAADQILTLDRRWRGLDPRVRLLEP
ncbi:PIN domain-containing protein [Candidatus Nephthysia bennettiae]|uniref:Ribonuclease VapC n=1 Tax=Candidatus Nephthysia bennettiae TaxID=3127016 RepID=A0A934K883_9BACT|nr:PIN domain-containing protein [Candidatus Dormibacteraeota bacterium]MBJ7612713.1 PIN domain-containing protein [Candidatus Dormibacteraeota bacterium]